MVVDVLSKKISCIPTQKSGIFIGLAQQCKIKSIAIDRVASTCAESWYFVSHRVVRHTMATGEHNLRNISRNTIHLRISTRPTSSYQDLGIECELILSNTDGRPVSSVAVRCCMVCESGSTETGTSCYMGRELCNATVAQCVIPTR